MKFSLEINCKYIRIATGNIKRFKVWDIFSKKVSLRWCLQNLVYNVDIKATVIDYGKLLKHGFFQNIYTF